MVSHKFRLDTASRVGNKSEFLGVIIIDAFITVYANKGNVEHVSKLMREFNEHFGTCGQFESEGAILQLRAQRSNRRTKMQQKLHGTNR